MKLNRLVKSIKNGEYRWRDRLDIAPIGPEGGATSNKPPIPPLDLRLDSRTVEEVMRILVSVQWDRWRFMLPAEPFTNLDVAVVSHGHLDHWHPNFLRKDLLALPPVKMPKPYKGLKNSYVGETVSLGKLVLRIIGRQELSKILKRDVGTLHAFWWLAETSNARVVFVGDMYAWETKHAYAFIEALHKQGIRVHATLLPSFGGARSHGKSAMDPSRSIEQLAMELGIAHKLCLGGLPHPVNAGWADFNAVTI